MFEIFQFPQYFLFDEDNANLAPVSILQQRIIQTTMLLRIQWRYVSNQAVNDFAVWQRDDTATDAATVDKFCCRRVVYPSSFPLFKRFLFYLSRCRTKFSKKTVPQMPVYDFIATKNTFCPTVFQIQVDGLDAYFTAFLTLVFSQ